MSGSDPLDGLHALAQAGEHAATPWAPEQVRRLGTRRRRRRIGLGAAAAALAVAVGGGALWSQTLPGTNRTPDPVATPTVASPTPPVAERTLTVANLLTAADVPVLSDQQRVVIAPSGVGRQDEISVCTPAGGVDRLGASAVLGRNFRIQVELPAGERPDPSDPLSGKPSIYTQAFQFSDPAAAREAYQTYRGWVAGCRAGLVKRGWTVLRAADQAVWHPVRTGVAGSTGEFAEWIYKVPGQPPDSGWFEAAGLTLAGDRMMVTVSLEFGQDKNVAYEQEPADPDLVAVHEQYGLVSAAAKRLPR